MKFILSILAIFIFNFVNAQYILRGSVKNQDNQAVPGVRISIQNTTYGVITNHKGEYFIELKKRQTYPISYSMIGMQDTTVEINIQQKTTIKNIILIEKSTELETVEVSAKKINRGKEIIKSVQANRKNMARQFDNYSCNTYLKTGLEKTPNPRLSGSTEFDTVITSPEKMNFIESYSKSKFKAPNHYQEEVLAHHDYAEKTNQNFSATVSIDIEDEVAPRQFVPSNPYIFFEKIEDGDFNLYQNMINLPKISEHPIVSPIAINAFANYKFKLEDIFYEGTQKIYKISVTPRFKEAPLFEGDLYVIDKLWVIKSFELKINSAAMPFFKDFTVMQDFELIDSFWVPTRREYIYSINDFTNIISANTRVNHSNYKFNIPLEKGDFGNSVMSYQSEAFNRDSTYWLANRPIQLKEAELNFIAYQDSIEEFRSSEAYLDSIDNVYNKITFWDVTLSGIGFRNRFKKQNIYINSILNSAKIFGVGGFRYGLGGSYSKQFVNAQKLKLTGQIDYGFNNKDVKGEMGIEYTFLPTKFGSIKINGGDVYDLITNYNSVLGTFSRGNYVRKKHISLSHRIEIINGLYGKIGFSYSDRQSITGLKLSNWSEKLFGALNEPQPFDRYKISMLEVQFLYRFKQKYIIKQNEKLIIGTKYPELEVTYKKGIPDLFDSEVDFDFVEFKISDEINLGNFGDAKWSAIGGSFFNANSIRFIEHKFFRGSDKFFFSNPLKSHQLLDSTFNTNKPYFQGFFIHHFNGYVMNKIPLINKLKLELSAGASTLLIDEANYSHAEIFAGLEKKFKIRQQYFKIGVWGNTRINNTTTAAFQFKLSIDFFNSYTNTWSY